MIGTKLIQELEAVFSTEENGFGRQGIILNVDYGRIEVKEYDPYLDPSELIDEIESLEENIRNLEIELDEAEYECKSLKSQVEKLERELEQHD